MNLVCTAMRSSTIELCSNGFKVVVKKSVIREYSQSIVTYLVVVNN